MGKRLGAVSVASVATKSRAEPRLMAPAIREGGSPRGASTRMELDRAPGSCTVPSSCQRAIWMQPGAQ